MRPYRHRVPVRRLTPTIRHASELLTPLAINRANSWRCPVSGTGPGLPTHPDSDPITTSNTPRCCDVHWNPPLAPGPPDPSIRIDVLAARQLLIDLAPPHRPVRTLTISDPTTRATLSALHGACDVLGQIARMNQTTFATLARSELVHIPTRLLDGESLSDDPTTAQAKLTGARRVIAPLARIRQTVQLYEAIGAVTGHVLPYQPAPVRAAHHDHPALFRQAEFEGRP